MTSPGPLLRPSIYLDPSVIEDTILGRLRPRDRAAICRLAAMVSEDVLSFYCPSEAREFIDHATPEQRARLGREYAALQVLRDASRGWLNEDAETNVAAGPDFQALVDLLESARNARHVVQARSTGVRDLLAAESSALVRKAPELQTRTGLRIFLPGDYLSRWSTQQQLRE